MKVVILEFIFFNFVHYFFKALLLLRASAEEILSIDQVSDIQWKVEALEKTQKECIQLLTEELENNRSVVAFFTPIEAPSIGIIFTKERKFDQTLPIKE